MEEGDVVLCTVERIESTTIFVKLPDGREGALIISEIAPGRIKNLREYVVPNKKIVCKILRISGNTINVSLRRVNSKEKQGVMEAYKLQQTAKSMFNQLLKEKAKEVEENILKKFSSLADFIEHARENQKLIEEYIPKAQQEQILKVVQKKKKEIEVKKTVKLKCLADNGITRIKKILSFNDKSVKTIYAAAGTFFIEIKAENYKDANHKMTQLLGNLEKQAKQNQCEYEVLDK